MNSLKTLDIVRKPGGATGQSFIMAAYKIGLLTTLGRKKHKEKISCKYLSQYRYCLINGILNDLALLQSRRCQIKEILLYKQLQLV